MFYLGKLKIFCRAATVFLLISVFAAGSFAQYKGAPVKKERLLKALRSRQLQTSDIVTVINSNGVDFELTAEIRQALNAAGARPEVIDAVENNLRSGDTLARSKRSNKKSARTYDELLAQALSAFREQNDPAGAVRLLRDAVKLNPKDSKAFQMLGFIHLYGLGDLTEAQKYMRQAIVSGGSAVFRVYHDDKGSFNERCTGSLYVSPERIRFESDDNVHTFETSTVNVDKIKLDRESSRTWKNYPIFKVFFKLGKDDVRFRFAPVTGKLEETQMASAFIEESKNRENFTGSVRASIR